MRTSIFFLLLLFLGGCQSEIFQQEERSFYMGVTPWPPDFTEIGKQKAYDFINKHCDMIVHHMGDGVPWEEALRGLPYPEEITKEVNYRLANNKGKVVYLEIAPLNVSRMAKAEYWNKEVSESLRQKWKNLPMDDTLVATAYFNFCCYLIDQFHPSFVNYGVEANSRDWKEKDFDQFRVFLDRVYHRLKEKYPGLPFFVSYMVSIDERLLVNAKKLNGFSDFVALSSYPYVEVGSHAYGATDPVNMPKDWYSKFRDIALEKPFAIAENGYIAEDLYLPEYGVTKKGNPVWQADYLQKLFEICNEYDAVFINYFCAYDYDHAYESLEALGQAAPYFKLWRDIGLYDGEGLERPSLQVWKKWQKASKL